MPATPNRGDAGCPPPPCPSPCPAGLSASPPRPPSAVCSRQPPGSGSHLPQPLRGRCHPLPRHWGSLCCSVAPSQPPGEQEHRPLLSACQSPWVAAPQDCRARVHVEPPVPSVHTLKSQIQLTILLNKIPSYRLPLQIYLRVGLVGPFEFRIPHLGI